MTYLDAQRKSDEEGARRSAAVAMKHARLMRQLSDAERLEIKLHRQLCVCCPGLPPSRP